MQLSHNELQDITGGPMPAQIVVPLATELDFEPVRRGRGLRVGLYQQADSDSYAYLNAETCPDCGAGMIRQGRCCACPSCGFESCRV